MNRGKSVELDKATIGAAFWGQSLTTIFPKSDIERVHHNETSSAEKLGLWQKICLVAKNDESQGEKYNDTYDKHSISKLVKRFGSMTSKLAPKWSDPAEIRERNDTNGCILLPKV